MLPADRPSPPVAPASNTPRGPLQRTTLPQISMSQDRWAALRTGKTSALATKQAPAPRRRAPHLRSTEIPRRRSTCECLFAARLQHSELPTPGVARPLTTKARRKFPPASTRILPPKNLSAGESRTSAMPVFRRESAPASSRFRSPPLDRRSAVRVPPQPPPRGDPPLSVPQDVLKTRSPATAIDRSPATQPASNRPSAHSRSPRQSPCLVYLARSSRIFVQLRCHAGSNGRQTPGSRWPRLATYRHRSIEIPALPSAPFPST